MLYKYTFIYSSLFKTDDASLSLVIFELKMITNESTL